MSETAPANVSDYLAEAEILLACEYSCATSEILKGKSLTAENIVSAFAENGVIGVVRYFHLAEWLAFHDVESLIKEYKHGVNYRGINAVEVLLFTNDLHVEYAVRVAEADEWGYDTISAEEYIRIRSVNGFVTNEELIIRY